MQKIDIIAGARPNFMKIGPIIHAIHRHNSTTQHQIQYRLIHTGQHYDKKMSEDFFEQLNIPKPHINFEVGSGSQATQTAHIMMRYEKLLEESKPELCVVVGDVTSTMACAIAAKKSGVKVAHVEGGIRSGDLNMPEEINRMVTDSITDYFFTTSEDANANLRKLGFGDDSIFFVGNTMIDSLLANMERLIKPGIYDQKQLQEKEYLVMTLHRPSNVDGFNHLKHLLLVIDKNVSDRKVIFPMHPRTRKGFDQLHLKLKNIIVTEPMSYLEFIYMVKYAKGVITDSGGITEESTVLGVPCMTLRTTTERPETVRIGTNEVVGIDPEAIIPYLKKLLEGKWKKGRIPKYWDGHTADRIVKFISEL